MTNCSSVSEKQLMTIGQALKQIRSRLAPVFGEFAEPESLIILETLLSLNRNELYLSAANEVVPGTEENIDTIVARRLNGEPLAYILGKAFFYSREFKVSPDVLIPRPDTETLIELVLARESDDSKRFLDIGTGSGIIVSVLAEARPRWKPYALDISQSALRIAKQNCPATVSLACADLLSAFKEKPFFDFIVSNPPYISDLEMEDLDMSVRGFEPHGALRGGPDGLHFYRLLAKQLPAVLKPDGFFFAEIGYNQGNEVQTIFTSERWRDVKVFLDLGGRPRVVLGKRPE